MSYLELAKQSTSPPACPEMGIGSDIPTAEMVRHSLHVLRRYLSPTLRHLDDNQLLALVNFQILVSWRKMIAEMREDKR
ncbi:hypothetical protein [Dehalogenimonas alkenigignens]|uniref:hypothetical protein n=1 Tax=Dehalogenimonas alkenigignens TaxID=1217799 RepID=UPI000D569D38|nr:hypothetical protein [Dehalogenimonas alkenigignens]PVV82560.1 hypothetical protein DD509_08460 [Dehalogenimonas alkenigignens]